MNERIRFCLISFRVILAVFCIDETALLLVSTFRKFLKLNYAAVDSCLWYTKCCLNENIRHLPPKA